jgi:hypothetical protein
MGLLRSHDRRDAQAMSVMGILLGHQDITCVTTGEALCAMAVSMPCVMRIT